MAIKIITYVVIGLLYVVFSYLKSKAKEKTIVVNSDDDDDESYEDRPNVNVTKELEELFAEMSVHAKQEVVPNTNLFEEGSDRVVQKEEKVETTSYEEQDTLSSKEQSALTIEDMRQALIYKTILDRVEY